MIKPFSLSWERIAGSRDLTSMLLQRMGTTGRRLGWSFAAGCLVLLAGCPTTSGRDGMPGEGVESVGSVSPMSDSDGETTQGTSPGSTSGGTSSNPSGNSGGPTTEAMGSSGNAPIFDLGSPPDIAPPDTGCRKVDFLFVVDNSGSMEQQQVRLLASFDGFIQAIQASLGEVVDSYHVGVVTSDAYSWNPPGCDGIGDLVSRTAAGGDCTPFAQGGRFATELDDLSVKFPCMAEVGAFGDGLEMPVTAAITALEPDNNMVGACNEGFLRDDAILVLVILTDDPPWEDSDDDAHLMADTSQWHDAIVDAKNGDPEAMVVIGFVPYVDTSCVFSEAESPNLIEFVQSFGDQGSLASICEADFGPTFAAAVGTITATCESFDPPG